MLSQNYNKRLSTGCSVEYYKVVISYSTKIQNKTNKMKTKNKIQPRMSSLVATQKLNEMEENKNDINKRN